MPITHLMIPNKHRITQKAAVVSEMEKIPTMPRSMRRMQKMPLTGQVKLLVEILLHNQKKVLQEVWQVLMITGRFLMDNYMK